MFGGFCNGMMVRKFQRWGAEAGRPDMQAVYLIRAMSEMTCICDRLDPTTLQKIPYRRGRRERLYNREQADMYMNGNRTNWWDYPYSWSHLFTQVGQEGWDPDF